jgi:hypothetical protein
MQSWMQEDGKNDHATSRIQSKGWKFILLTVHFGAKRHIFKHYTKNPIRGSPRQEDCIKPNQTKPKQTKANKLTLLLAAGAKAEAEPTRARRTAVNFILVCLYFFLLV